MNDLRDIAEGGTFDTAAAIRLLAKHVYLLAQPNMADQTPTPTAAAAPATDDHVFTKLFNARLAATLLKAGVKDIEDLRRASDEALLAVNGINDKAVAQIRERTAS